MTRTHASPVSRREFLASAFGLTLCAATGCGYMVGGPYRQDIHTVHVPIFTSASFRRGVEFQLTEAVQKEIQNQTPFRLAKGEYADTRLTGRITSIRKRVLGETAQDDPRQLQYQVALQVTWEDLRTQRVIREQRIDIPPDVVPLLAQSSFAPELGQSMATARQRAVDNLARQIVQLMQTPW